MPNALELQTANNWLSPALQPAPSSTPVPLGAPAEALSLFQDGVAQLQIGEAGNAMVALAASLERAPDFAPAHLAMGMAQALTCKIYPAIDSLANASRLQPHSFATHFITAQLYFKLRVPKKGYEAAREALRCAQVPEHRGMLAQMLKEERERERRGINRPTLDKPFSASALYVAASGMAAAILALVVHFR